MASPTHDQDTKPTPIRPDANAVSGREKDQAAGGADSAPYETVPSGEKHEAAHRPQDAPVPREGSP
jgi:hypothetical protein